MNKGQENSSSMNSINANPERICPMNRRYKNSKRFFTLLEVLVSMGVFTILMLALMQFFSAAQTVWERSGNRTETFESARLVIQMLQQDLVNAFHGDENHDMSKLQFFGYTETGTPVTQKDLTFATERNGVLTAVNYRWESANSADATACTVSFHKIEGNAIEKATWITRNGTDWRNEVKSPTHTVLMQNVMFFKIKAQYWTDPTTLSGLGDLPTAPTEAYQKRPPALAYITIGVIRDDALEKLGRLLSPAVTDITSETERKKVFVGISTDFSAVFDEDGFFKSSSLDETTENLPHLPKRRIIYEGTQFFNILVHIDR